ncbi:vWA domain-containing protein [Terracoccus luteus]|uniref:Ca-activated chloride channel family protein n=1 Tax=Terracoccus luteus TaxID=53356 RepID=A0A839Q1S6_9MICO|nr:VWA domain-containing protein [Terracoccus luteus]MBB2987032.1 Ca-activated chloride channel family protein [Terracoccus luteus]MCP2172683.1 Ca-activated chloride channel family protein [Terracoccus luteus]
MTRPRTDPSSPSSPRRLSARLRRLGPVAAAVAGSALLAVPASASATAVTPAVTPAVTSTVTPALSPARTTSVPTMVVLDASGSMNESDAPGPRIDAAKRAVTSLVAGLPADSRIGLIVYGTGTGSTRAEKSTGCTDIRTLIPVGPLDRARTTDAVTGIRASGYTPIGNALRSAATALPTEGPRAIVLVSDGIDTCAPPAPCNVAKQLKRQGVDLTIHTVGFKVDPTARAQLSCIADATGGTYSDAGDADTLEQALKVKVDYAISGYQARGTPVTGTDQPTDASPRLAPGQYLDTFATGAPAGSDRTGRVSGTTKYYRVPLQQGATLYVSATMPPPAADPGGTGGTFGVQMTLQAEDGSTCDSADANYAGNDGYSHRPVSATMSTVLDHDTPPGAYPGRCPVDGVGVVKIERYGAKFGDQSRPVEIVVRSEPPAETAGLPPAATRAQAGLARPPFARAATAVTGGSSFNDAAPLTSGQTYRGTVVTGEDRYFSVPLRWGQRLAYSVEEVGPASDGPTTGVGARVSVYNPVRQDVRSTGQYQTAIWFAGNPGLLTGSTVAPVRYTNRSSSQPDLRTTQVDGLYYLRLSVNVDGEDSPAARTTYRITVVVDGDPETGPAYRPGATGMPTGSASSTPPPSDATTATAGPTTGPGDSATAGATGTVDASGTSGTSGTTGSSGSSASSGPGWAVLGGIALAAVGGALVALLVGRARRGQPPTGPQT